MRSRWTPEKLRELKALIRGGNHSISQMAKILGFSKSRVMAKIAYEGLSNMKYMDNFIKRAERKNIKIMKFYYKHGKQATLDHFGITEKHLKSVKSYIYSNEEFKDIRHPTWRWFEFEEIMFVLQHISLKSNGWIGAKLNRGKQISVRNSIKAKRIRDTRYFHGLGIEDAHFMLGREDIPTLYVMSSSGEKRLSRRLVPWVILHQYYAYKRKDQNKEILSLLRSAAMFQKMIYGKTTAAEVFAVMEEICQKE